jgi:hypothetical protein
VVPERGMPTMKTGAGSELLARGPRAKRAASNVSMVAATNAA